MFTMSFFLFVYLSKKNSEIYLTCSSWWSFFAFTVYRPIFMNLDLDETNFRLLCN